MAGEPPHPRREGNQDGAVCAVIASVHRTHDWNDSTGVSRPHVVLDGRRPGEEVARFQLYYNGFRAHAALRGRPPSWTSDEGVLRARLDSYRWRSHCRGL